MTILVIYAGGTIGMKPDTEGYIPMEGFETFLTSHITSRNDSSIPKFDVISLDNLIDSSNLAPSDWTAIGLTLEKNWDRYSGFILLHGTDTMAYTASMLSFMLRDCDKPVIVTGSQIPMLETRNDATNNFLTSLSLAKNADISEVCIYFNGLLIRGNRATKVSSQNLEAFDSPNYPRLGKVGINTQLNKSLFLPVANQPSFNIPTFSPAAVTIVHTYPGMQTNHLKVMIEDSSTKGLVLCTFGAGNPPSEDDGFMEILRIAHDRGICVVNTTQCLNGGVAQGAYATNTVLGKLGVISGCDMTLEAAFTKLHFLLASDISTKKVRELMMTSLCGDITRN